MELLDIVARMPNVCRAKIIQTAHLIDIALIAIIEKSKKSKSKNQKKIKRYYVLIEKIIYHRTIILSNSKIFFDKLIIIFCLKCNIYKNKNPQKYVYI